MARFFLRQLSIVMHNLAMESGAKKLAQCEAMLERIAAIVQDQRALEQYQRSLRPRYVVDIDLGRADAYRKIDRLFGRWAEPGATSSGSLPYH
jgi:hypothetical protein